MDFLLVYVTITLENIQNDRSPAGKYKRSYGRKTEFIRVHGR